MPSALSRQQSEPYEVQSSRFYEDPSPIDAPRSLQDAVHYSYSARGHITAGRVPTSEARRRPAYELPHKPPTAPPDWLKDRKVNERFLSHGPTEWSLARRKHGNGMKFKSNFTSSEVRLAEAMCKSEIKAGTGDGTGDGTQRATGPDIDTTRACSAVLKDVASTSSLPPAMQILLQKLSSHIDRAIFRPNILHNSASRPSQARHNTGTGTDTGLGPHSLSNALAYSSLASAKYRGGETEEGGGFMVDGDGYQGLDTKLTYFQFAQGLDEERKKLASDVDTYKALHKQKVDEALELIARRAEHTSKLDSLKRDDAVTSQRLDDLAVRKKNLREQLAELQGEHDGLVRRHEEVRVEMDGTKGEVRDLQQHTMTMKMQRKAVRSQLHDHQLAEQKGVVTVAAVQEAEGDLRAMETLVEGKKDAYSEALKNTVEVLEGVRVAQNRRKQVQLQADTLAAEQAEYLRSHTPRPEWTNKEGDFLPAMKVESFSDSDDSDDGDFDGEDVDAELAAIHADRSSSRRKKHKPQARSVNKDWEEWMNAGDMDDDGSWTDAEWDSMQKHGHGDKRRYQDGREQRRREQATAGQGAEQSTVERVTLLSSTMREMRVETKAHRLLESRQRLIQLRADLHQSLQDLKSAMQSNPLKMLAVAPAASAMLTKDGKSFVGKGMADHIPRYLRTNEKVSFRLIPMKELQTIIRDIWIKKRTWGQGKGGQEVPAAQLGVNMTMNDFLYKYLQRKYGIHPVIIKWGYAITYAVLNFKWDEEVELFYLVLMGQIPEEVYYYQDDMLKNLKSCLKKMNTQLLGANVKESKLAMIKKADCNFFLSSFFPHKNSDDFAHLKEAADKTMTIGGPGDTATKPGEKELSPMLRRRKQERMERMEKERAAAAAAAAAVEAGGGGGDGDGDVGAGTGPAAVPLGIAPLGIGGEEPKEWKEGDDINIDVILATSEDGERTVFEKAVRAQHLHEVQKILGRLEDLLTVGAAPGVLIRASKVLQICRSFNEAIGTREVISVLHRTEPPHRNIKGGAQQQQQQQQQQQEVKKKRLSLIQRNANANANATPPAAAATATGDAIATAMAAATAIAAASGEDANAEGGASTSDETAMDAIPHDAEVNAVPSPTHPAPSHAGGRENKKEKSWHGLTEKNFVRKAPHVLVDINALVQTMKLKGLVKGLLNQYTYDSVERSDTHIVSVAERRASAIHRWNLARINLAGLVRFRSETEEQQQQQQLLQKQLRQTEQKRF